LRVTVTPELRLTPLRTVALDGTRRDLPQDLPAERTLVLLAYQQRHQRDVDAWIALAVANGAPPTPRGAIGPMATAVIEVPFLSARWKPLRRIIDGGMARGIADPDVLARTLTAYGAPSRHRRASGLTGSGAADGREVEALVVMRDGRVLWHATGAPDTVPPGEVDAMLRALDSASGRSSDTDAAASPEHPDQR
jgi:hypothetical protein